MERLMSSGEHRATWHDASYRADPAGSEISPASVSTTLGFDKKIESSEWTLRHYDPRWVTKTNGGGARSRVRLWGSEGYGRTRGKARDREREREREMKEESKKRENVRQDTREERSKVGRLCGEWLGTDNFEGANNLCAQLGGGSL